MSALREGLNQAPSTGCGSSCDLTDITDLQYVSLRCHCVAPDPSERESEHDLPSSFATGSGADELCDERDE